MRFQLSLASLSGAQSVPILLSLSLLFAHAQAGSVSQHLPEKGAQRDIAVREATRGDFPVSGFSLETRQASMCGKNSAGGNQKCGLDLCCSASGWCGATSDYCSNGCQSGFGKCSVVKPPSCSPTGGSVNGRTIGYYQSWASDRKCQAVSPKQIKTAGYTHLFFSFASINPTSFQVEPARAADVAAMSEFTSLKTSKLQTWIAIGGGDFSLVDKTRTTWSDMTSTAARRATFINSLKAYMDKYGFQGVDLDWEYPGSPAHGGKPADTQNYVNLVKEMRASFGTKYGISVILASDYEYLRWYAPKAMEPYVDFFGFMSYDYHGSWEAPGGLMQAQSDIRDIEKSALPLWFNGLNPAKVNFGIALYGRGYTLSDRTCNRIFHCTWKAPNKPGPCTSDAGAMSLREIQDLIKQKSLSPVYIPESLVKRISWDDQLMVYDDDQTIAAKKQWANSQCFGGSMYWSVDFGV